MGAIVAVRPLRRSQRRAIIGWIIAFIVFGGAVSEAEFIEQRRSTQAIEKLDTAVTGGNNYVYLAVRPVIAPNGCPTQRSSSLIHNTGMRDSCVKPWTLASVSR
jgi:hypothetical protein